MTDKHTPGPWRKAGHYVAGPKYTIANCHFANGNSREQEFNTRLLAAAPELLEACKAIFDGAPDEPISNYWGRLAAVIHLATGE